jgi:hypothetical protein
MKKFVTSLLLLIIFYFPVFSQETAISLRTYKLNNGIDLLKKEFSPNANQMYNELVSQYIGNINDYEIIKVYSFIDFLDWVETQNYTSIVKSGYTNSISKDVVGKNSPNTENGTKKIALLYLKNEAENFDKLICYLINY